MIEKMKKFTFLVTDREYEEFIHSIRELGVVHVSQLGQGSTSPELQEAIATEQAYRSAMDYLKIVLGKFPLSGEAKVAEASAPSELL
jgi:V/A-type H+-transporting ATPase subunit I